MTQFITPGIGRRNIFVYLHFTALQTENQDKKKKKKFRIQLIPAPWLWKPSWEFVKNLYYTGMICNIHIKDSVSPTYEQFLFNALQNEVPCKQICSEYLLSSLTKQYRKDIWNETLELSSTSSEIRSNSWAVYKLEN